MNKKKNEDIEDEGGYAPYLFDYNTNSTLYPKVALTFLEPLVNLQPVDLGVNLKEINPLEYQKYNDKFITLLEKDIICSQGIIVLPYIKDVPEAFNYFKKLLIFLNIIGIPSNFADTAVITVFYIEKSVYSYVEYTRSHHNIGDLSQLIDITKTESKSIIDDINKIHFKCESNKFLRETLIYEFLARGKRAFLNRDFRLSFIFNWIFIEALISKKWEEFLIKKHGSKNKTKFIIDSKHWTIAIKIEELFLGDKISEENMDLLNELRKKRNSLFHFEVKKKKRKIDFIDAKKCFSMAMELFYNEIDLEYKDEYIDYKEVREIIEKGLQRTTPSFFDLLKKENLDGFELL